MSAKTSLSLALIGCGLSLAAIPVQQASAQTSPSARWIAYIHGPDAYPAAFRQVIRGYPVAWSHSSHPDVVVVPVNASEEEAKKAMAANRQDGVSLVIYKGDLAPSPGFLKQFIIASSTYAEVIKGGQMLRSYEYSAGQWPRFGKAIDGELAVSPQTRAQVKTADGVGSVSEVDGNAQIIHPVVSGEHLTQFRRDLEYKVDKDGSGDYYADLTLQITGTRNDDAETAKQQVYWTASVQGSGFNGQALFQEVYTPGLNGNSNISQWQPLVIPLHYTVKLALGQGTSAQPPIVEAYSPSNQSITSDYMVSTGWNVGANGSLTASAKGPSATGGVSAGMTDSESHRITIKDSTLLVNVDLKNAAYAWDLKYTSFNGYTFSQYGANAFLSSNTSAYDSNMLLDNFNDLAPTMQAYQPMYNVQYETQDSDSAASHQLTLSIGEQQWSLGVKRTLASWNTWTNGYPQSSATESVVVANSF